MKPYVGKEGIEWTEFFLHRLFIEREIAFRLPNFRDFIPLYHLNSGIWMGRKELHRKIAESEF